MDTSEHQPACTCQAIVYNRRHFQENEGEAVISSQSPLELMTLILRDWYFRCFWFLYRMFVRGAEVVIRTGQTLEPLTVLDKSYTKASRIGHDYDVNSLLRLFHFTRNTIDFSRKETREWYKLPSCNGLVSITIVLLSPWADWSRTKRGHCKPPSQLTGATNLYNDATTKRIMRWPYNPTLISHSIRSLHRRVFEILRF